MVRNFHKINLIDNAEMMFQGINQNVVLENETIQLVDKLNEGFIESCDIKCDPFTKMVASWVAITDKERTVEVMISVRVDGKWSKYLSYGAWGLGRENYYYNDEDELAEIYVDEIYIKNGNSGDEIMLLEPYPVEPMQLAGFAAESITLDEDEYFVLGDNSQDSFDSRYWDDPFVRTCDIVACVFVKWGKDS